MSEMSEIMSHRHRTWEKIILAATLVVSTTRDVQGFHSPILHPHGRFKCGLSKDQKSKRCRLRKHLLISSNRSGKVSSDPSLVLQLRVTDDEPCIAGSNTVTSCDIPPNSMTPLDSSSSRGTQTTLSAATNIGKCICGAGSFALPHVFLKEGVLGGTLAMGICAILATWTMQSLNDSRYSPALLLAEEGFVDSNDTNENYDGKNDNKTTSRNKITRNNFPPTSYVSLAEQSLGKPSSTLVFTLTLAASLGVCSTYIAFIGQTLSSLSSDATSNNFIHQLAPNLPETTWEFLTALTVLPLSLVRNYGIFAFTSALGVTAVLGGILVTLTYGILVDPGMGFSQTLSSISHLPLWPDSMGDAFGGSFGTIAYLFCVNFLTFPIMTSMENPKEDYNTSVTTAVSGVWLVNVLFAIVCLAFYGAETQDLVLQNLENGVYLVLLKVLLCVDLIFTFPVVFSSGRQILENAILGGVDRNGDENFAGNENDVATNQDEEGESTSLTLALSRGAITTTAVGTCYGLSQTGGFGVVANLIGGVAQGTLAFIVPPAIAIALKRRENKGRLDVANELPQWLIAIFGGAVVSAVTYFTFSEAMN